MPSPDRAVQNVARQAFPRKPERFDEVADLIARRGHACRRRSRHGETASESGSRPVFLGDTMGELRKFYSLATVVFVIPEYS